MTSPVLASADSAKAATGCQSGVQPTFLTTRLTSIASSARQRRDVEMGKPTAVNSTMLTPECRAM